MSFDYHLHWEDSDADTSPFEIIDLISTPRVGEFVWFQHVNEYGEVVRDYVVRVTGIVHVSAYDDFDSYIELHISEEYADDEEDDEEDEEEYKEEEAPEIVECNCGCSYASEPGVTM